ncbi:Inner membrane transport permease YbhR [Planctomycetes bacterium Poly30]|uniref:Transport permease protein n=1 Tax=Saltatorellus ferox TaxID=2528018 RepID=A0A518EPL2_9BACT|nr:Inner membrane transport permease YbhR [Planctomycetes bacterium Poly30]
MNFTTAWALARKDLRLLMRDRTALFFAFALPLVLASVMGSALGSAMSGGGGGSSTSGPRKMAIAIEDRAQNESSRALLERIGASEGLEFEVVEDAERAVANGDQANGLVIGESYGKPGAKGLELFRDPARQIASQVVVFQLVPLVMGASYGDSFGKMATADGLTEMLGLTVHDLKPKARGGVPRSAGESHAFASMAVMMLLFNLVAAAGTLQDERAEGTLDRLRLTPSAGSSVLLGKTLVTMTMAVVQLIVLFAFGTIVYEIPVMEHLPEIAVISLVWASTASALGLLFATACSTRKQLEGLSTLVILGMSAVGGAWFPREITPQWFQTAGLVTPVAWAMDAYEGVLWYGKSFASTADLDGIGLKLVVLMGYGVVLFGVSVLLYRRRFMRA